MLGIRSGQADSSLSDSKLVISTKVSGILMTSRFVCVAIVLSFVVSVWVPIVCCFGFTLSCLAGSV